MRAMLALTLLIWVVPASVAAQSSTSPVLSDPRFEQAALTVADIDTARLFYRDRLGLRLMFEANNMLFFDVGGTRLMIAKDSERQRLARPGAILYFHVDDFAAALNRLQGIGTMMVGAVETVQITKSGALKLQQFEDADGNMLAIMGFVPV
jgi:methylmalonyl-CoA/ethylmalonyl-CoA epimerase